MTQPPRACRLRMPSSNALVDVLAEHIEKVDALMQDQDATIDALIRFARSSLPGVTLETQVFGSRWAGDANADSDIDLAMAIEADGVRLKDIFDRIATYMKGMQDRTPHVKTEHYIWHNNTVTIDTQWVHVDRNGFSWALPQHTIRKP